MIQQTGMITGDMIKRLDPLGLTPKQRERSDLNAEIERITADTPIGQMIRDSMDRIMFEHWLKEPEDYCPERSHE